MSKSSSAADGVVITGDHLQKFFRQSGLDEKSLAEILNVAPRSLRRWAAPTKDAPTSTTYLVLLPLLVGAGIDIIPDGNGNLINDDLKRLGHEKKLGNAEKRRALRTGLFALTNEDMRAARRLFLELQKAWAQIDKDTTALGPDAE